MNRYQRRLGDVETFIRLIGATEPDSALQDPGPSGSLSPNAIHDAFRVANHAMLRRRLGLKTFGHVFRVLVVFNSDGWGNNVSTQAAVMEPYDIVVEVNVGMTEETTVVDSLEAETGDATAALWRAIEVAENNMRQSAGHQDMLTPAVIVPVYVQEADFSRDDAHRFDHDMAQMIHRGVNDALNGIGFYDSVAKHGVDKAAVVVDLWANGFQFPEQAGDQKLTRDSLLFRARRIYAALTKLAWSSDVAPITLEAFPGYMWLIGIMPDPIEDGGTGNVRGVELHRVQSTEVEHYRTQEAADSVTDELMFWFTYRSIVELLDGSPTRPGSSTSVGTPPRSDDWVLSNTALVERAERVVASMLFPVGRVMFRWAGYDFASAEAVRTRQLFFETRGSRRTDIAKGTSSLTRHVPGEFDPPVEGLFHPAIGSAESPMHTAISSIEIYQSPLVACEPPSSGLAYEHAQFIVSFWWEHVMGIQGTSAMKNFMVPGQSAAAVLNQSFMETFVLATMYSVVDTPAPGTAPTSSLVEDAENVLMNVVPLCMLQGHFDTMAIKRQAVGRQNALAPGAGMRVFHDNPAPILKPLAFINILERLLGVLSDDLPVGNYVPWGVPSPSRFYSSSRKTLRSPGVNDVVVLSSAAAYYASLMQYAGVGARAGRFLAMTPHWFATHHISAMAHLAETGPLGKLVPFSVGYWADEAALVEYLEQVFPVALPSTMVVDNVEWSRAETLVLLNAVGRVLHARAEASQEPMQTVYVLLLMDLSMFALPVHSMGASPIAHNQFVVAAHASKELVPWAHLEAVVVAGPASSVSEHANLSRFTLDAPTELNEVDLFAVHTDATANLGPLTSGIYTFDVQPAPSLDATPPKPYSPSPSSTPITVSSGSDATPPALQNEESPSFMLVYSGSSESDGSSSSSGFFTPPVRGRTWSSSESNSPVGPLTFTPSPDATFAVRGPAIESPVHSASAAAEPARNNPADPSLVMHTSPGDDPRVSLEEQVEQWDRVLDNASNHWRNSIMNAPVAGMTILRRGGTRRSVTTRQLILYALEMLPPVFGVWNNFGAFIHEATNLFDGHTMLVSPQSTRVVLPLIYAKTVAADAQPQPNSAFRPVLLQLRDRVSDAPESGATAYYPTALVTALRLLLALPASDFAAQVQQLGPYVSTLVYHVDFLNSMFWSNKATLVTLALRPSTGASTHDESESRIHVRSPRRVLSSPETKGPRTRVSDPDTTPPAHGLHVGSQVPTSDLVQSMAESVVSEQSGAAASHELRRVAEATSALMETTMEQMVRRGVMETAVESRHGETSFDWDEDVPPSAQELLLAIDEYAEPIDRNLSGSDAMERVEQEFLAEELEARAALVHADGSPNGVVVEIRSDSSTSEWGWSDSGSPPFPLKGLPRVQQSPGTKAWFGDSDSDSDSESDDEAVLSPTSQSGVKSEHSSDSESDIAEFLNPTKSAKLSSPSMTVVQSLSSPSGSPAPSPTMSAEQTLERQEAYANRILLDDRVLEDEEDMLPPTTPLAGSVYARLADHTARFEMMSEMLRRKAIVEHRGVRVDGKTSPTTPMRAVLRDVNASVNRARKRALWVRPQVFFATQEPSVIREQVDVLGDVCAAIGKFLTPARTRAIVEAVQARGKCNPDVTPGMIRIAVAQLRDNYRKMRAMRITTNAMSGEDTQRVQLFLKDVAHAYEELEKAEVDLKRMQEERIARARRAFDKAARRLDHHITTWVRSKYQAQVSDLERRVALAKPDAPIHAELVKLQRSARQVVDDQLDTIRMHKEMLWSAHIKRVNAEVLYIQQQIEEARQKLVHMTEHRRLVGGRYVVRAATAMDDRSTWMRPANMSGDGESEAVPVDPGVYACVQHAVMTMLSSDDAFNEVPMTTRQIKQQVLEIAETALAAQETRYRGIQRNALRIQVQLQELYHAGYVANGAVTAQYNELQLAIGQAVMREATSDAEDPSTLYDAHFYKAWKQVVSELVVRNERTPRQTTASPDLGSLHDVTSETLALRQFSACSLSPVIGAGVSVAELDSMSTTDLDALVTRASARVADLIDSDAWRRNVDAAAHVLQSMEDNMKRWQSVDRIEDVLGVPPVTTATGEGSKMERFQSQASRYDIEHPVRTLSVGGETVIQGGTNQLLVQEAVGHVSMAIATILRSDNYTVDPKMLHRRLVQLREFAHRSMTLRKVRDGVPGTAGEWLVQLNNGEIDSHPATSTLSPADRVMWAAWQGCTAPVAIDDLTVPVLSASLLDRLAIYVHVHDVSELIRYDTTESEFDARAVAFMDLGVSEFVTDVDRLYLQARKAFLSGASDTMPPMNARSRVEFLYGSSVDEAVPATIVTIDGETVLNIPNWRIAELAERVHNRVAQTTASDLAENFVLPFFQIAQNRALRQTRVEQVAPGEFMVDLTVEERAFVLDYYNAYLRRSDPVSQRMQRRFTSIERIPAPERIRLMEQYSTAVVVQAYVRAVEYAKRRAHSRLLQMTYLAYQGYFGGMIALNSIGAMDLIAEAVENAEAVQNKLLADRAKDYASVQVTLSNENYGAMISERNYLYHVMSALYHLELPPGDIGLEFLHSSQMTHMIRRIASMELITAVYEAVGTWPDGDNIDMILPVSSDYHTRSIGHFALRMLASDATGTVRDMAYYVLNHVIRVYAPSSTLAGVVLILRRLVDAQVSILQRLVFQIMLRVTMSEYAERDGLYGDQVRLAVRELANRETRLLVDAIAYERDMNASFAARQFLLQTFLPSVYAAQLWMNSKITKAKEPPIRELHPTILEMNYENLLQEGAHTRLRRGAGILDGVDFKIIHEDPSPAEVGRTGRSSALASLVAHALQTLDSRSDGGDHMKTVSQVMEFVRDGVLDADALLIEQGVEPNEARAFQTLVREYDVKSYALARRATSDGSTPASPQRPICCANLRVVSHESSRLLERVARETSSVRRTPAQILSEASVRETGYDLALAQIATERDERIRRDITLGQNRIIEAIEQGTAEPPTPAQMARHGYTPKSTAAFVRQRGRGRVVISDADALRAQGYSPESINEFIRRHGGPSKVTSQPPVTAQSDVRSLVNRTNISALAHAADIRPGADRQPPANFDLQLRMQSIAQNNTGIEELRARIMAKQPSALVAIADLTPVGIDGRPDVATAVQSACLRGREIHTAAPTAHAVATRVADMMNVASESESEAEAMETETSLQQFTRDHAENNIPGDMEMRRRVFLIQLEELAGSTSVLFPVMTGLVATADALSEMLEGAVVEFSGMIERLGRRVSNLGLESWIDSMFLTASALRSGDRVPIDSRFELLGYRDAERETSVPPTAFYLHTSRVLPSESGLFLQGRYIQPGELFAQYGGTVFLDNAVSQRADLTAYLEHNAAIPAVPHKHPAIVVPAFTDSDGVRRASVVIVGDGKDQWRMEQTQPAPVITGAAGDPRAMQGSYRVAPGSYAVMVPTLASLVRAPRPLGPESSIDSPSTMIPPVSPHASRQPNARLVFGAGPHPFFVYLEATRLIVPGEEILVAIPDMLSPSRRRESPLPVASPVIENRQIRADQTRGDVSMTPLGGRRGRRSSRRV